MNWYSINNSIKNKVEVSIDEEIGGWGINAKNFIDELKASGEKDVELTINSYGGSVIDAFAIYDHLKNGTYNVKVKVEGVAASAATIIALAGNELPVMTENSFFMIHNPWLGVMVWDAMEADDLRDKAEELENTAKTLDKMTNRIASVYSKASGMSIEDIKSLMDAETWFDASDAKDSGFVSEIEGALAIAAYASPESLAKKGYKVPSNYVNQLNNVNMSDNAEKSFMDKLKALINGTEEAKAEAPKKEEPKVDVEALKAEISASLTADMDAKLEESTKEVEELKAAHEAEVLAKATEVEELKKELDKAKASRKPLEDKADVANPEKKEEVKDELGSVILNVFKTNGLI